jgi:hypothetical protein
VVCCPFRRVVAGVRQQADREDSKQVAGLSFSENISFLLAFCLLKYAVRTVLIQHVETARRRSATRCMKQVFEKTKMIVPSV